MAQKKEVRIINGERVVVYASTGCPFGEHIIGSGHNSKPTIEGQSKGHRIHQTGNNTAK